MIGLRIINNQYQENHINGIKILQIIIIMVLMNIL